MTWKDRVAAAWKKGLGLALILILAAVLRTQHMRADPPALIPFLSGSAGIYFDEGIYCHNARNKILFGEWITDDWNPLVYNAPLTLIYYFGFKLFGVSIVTVKAINIIFGLLGILLFHACLRRYLEPGPSLALTALFAFDFYWLMYNRTGLLENYSAFCFLLCFYLFLRFEENLGSAFLLGFALAIAVLSKYLFVYFLISTLLSTIYKAWRFSKFRSSLMFLAGIFTAWLPWFLLIYLPFRSTFGRIAHGWEMLAFPVSIGRAWSNLLHNPLPRYIQLMPVESFLLVLFFGWTLLKLVRSPGGGRGPKDVTVFIFLWIAGGISAMGILNYRPLRYFLPLMPALYLAISILIKDRDWIRSKKHLPWPLPILMAAMFFWLFRFIAAGHAAFMVFPLILRLLIFLSMAGILMSILVPSKVGKTSVEAAVLVIMLGCSLYLYDTQFYRKPTYRLEEASRFMETLPAGSVLMGQEAPRLGLETRFKTFLAYNLWFNYKDTFRRFAPTHLLILDKFGNAERDWIRRIYPQVIASLRLVRRFRVWDSTVSLYQIPK